MSTKEQMEPERLMSLNEGGSLLGLSVYTMRDWAKRGVISTHKLGGRRLVSSKEIERLMKISHQPARRELATI
jgi:excisionase family DNA binding protein